MGLFRHELGEIGWHIKISWVSVVVARETALSVAYTVERFILAEVMEDRLVDVLGRHNAAVKVRVTGFNPYPHGLLAGSLMSRCGFSA
jgi:hypothetical protein